MSQTGTFSGDVRTIELSDKINDIFKAYESGDIELDEWEEKFICDMWDRNRKYGTKVIISANQADKIEQIWEDL